MNDWISPYHDCEKLVKPEFDLVHLKGEVCIQAFEKFTGATTEGGISIPMMRRSGDNPDCMGMALVSGEWVLGVVYAQNAKRDGENTTRIEAMAFHPELLSFKLADHLVYSVAEALKSRFQNVSFDLGSYRGTFGFNMNLRAHFTGGGVAPSRAQREELLEAWLRNPPRQRLLLRNPATMTIQNSDRISVLKYNLLELPRAHDPRKFHNIHEGKRVFILASGPSLNEVNLAKLKDEKVIVVNRSLLAYPEADYTVSMAEHAFANFGCLLSQSRELFTTRDRPFGIKMPTLGIHGFSFDIHEGVYTGDTVSMVALQVAVYMGFRKIHFLGLDLKNSPSLTHFFGQEKLNLNHDQVEFPRMQKAFEQVLPMLKSKGYRVTNSSPVCEIKAFEFVDWRYLVD